MRFQKSTMPAIAATAFRVAMLPALVMMVAACSDVKFSTVSQNGPGVVTQATPGSTPVPGSTPTCGVETIYRKTKIMFLVDTSGSNATAVYNIINGQNVLTAVSDPIKRFRGGVINDFFTTYQHKTNFNWSFSTFQGSSAQAYIGSNSTPRFSVNSADMGSAIQSFYNSSDSGETPYAASIALATRAVAQDPDLNSADQPNYFVILLSDGFPTDYTDMYGNFRSAQMQSDVGALMAAAPGRVTLSTIYYSATSQSIPVAVNDLQQIASAGGGKFANVNTSSNTFKIDDVISSSTVCH
jgi:hypothetical protein